MAHPGLFNATQGRPLTARVRHARRWLARLRGLLGTTSIDPEDALVIWDTSSIHMMWMLYSIDVAFLAPDGKVLALCPNRAPFSFPVWARGAMFAVEMAAGTLARTGIALGDQVTWPDPGPP